MDDLSTLWACWQGNVSGRERFSEVVSNVSGRSDTGALPRATEELRSELPKMLDWLCNELNVPSGSECVELFRGVSDEAATDIRVDLARGGEPQVSTAGPLSYSRTRGAALGFARKGCANGLLYVAQVRLADVLFVDRPGIYVNENYLTGESEVVVWHRKPPQHLKVVELHVEPGAGSATRPADVQERRLKKAQVEHREADRMKP